MGKRRKKQALAAHAARPSLNVHLLRAIANCAFLRRRESTIGLFSVPYTVQWRVLGRLARTCQALRQHFEGLHEFYIALPRLLAGDPVDLPRLPRWQLSSELLLAGAYRLYPEFGGERLSYRVDPFVTFTVPTVIRLNLPAVAGLENSPGAKEQPQQPKPRPKQTEKQRKRESRRSQHQQRRAQARQKQWKN